MILIISSYLLVVLYIFNVCIRFDANTKFAFFTSLSFILISLITLREGWPDLENYQYIFEGACQLDLNDFSIFGRTHIRNMWIESGFVLLNYIIGLLSNNFYVFLVSVGFLELYLFYRFAKIWFDGNLKKIMLSFAFGLPYLGYMYLFVTIRAGLAIAIAANAFLIKATSLKNIIIKILVYAIALSFHKSIVIIVLFDFIYNFYYTKYFITNKMLCVIFFLSFFTRTRLFNSLFINILDWFLSFFTISGFAKYLTTDNFRNFWPLRDLLFCFMAFLLLVFCKKINSIRFNKLLLICILGLCVNNIGGSIVTISRISDFFFFSIPLMFAEVYSNKSIMMKYSYFLFLFAIVYSPIFLSYFFKYCHILMW